MPKASYTSLLRRFPVLPTRVNGVTITPETIIATRRHFAELHWESAKGYHRPGGRGEALGKSPAEMARYKAQSWARIKGSYRGEGDCSLTFLQRALWLQEGQMVPMLS